jgi:imidazolonepropionase-like amidohydrolase
MREANPMTIKPAGIPLLAAAAVLAVGSAAAQDRLAVKAGTIYPIAGEPVRNGVVLVRDGKIEAIGADVRIPWDALVLGGERTVVMPGFVLAHTSQGMDRPNENVPNVPFVTVTDAIDPVSPFFEDSLRDGITTMLVIPGNSTQIGGQGLIVKPFGRTVEAMSLGRGGGLKISMTPRGNASRMGHVQQLRRLFIEVENYLKSRDEEREETPGETKEEKEGDDEEREGSGGSGEDGDRSGRAAREDADDESAAKRRQAMVDLLQGRLRAFVYCREPQDVLHAFELQEKYRFPMVLVVGPRCRKAADLIAKKGHPVILDAQLVSEEEDEESGQIERVPVVPAFLRAGVKIAFQNDASSFGSRYLWYQAATAVKQGMSRDDALAAITRWPAEILGIADRAGTLEKGKDANLLLLTGDPLDAQTWVETVVLEGKIVYERSKDEKLKRLTLPPSK